ncbi:MAG TPA: ABC transporter permease [Ginsengibacter sp.]
MFKNHLQIAFRNILKRKGYTLFNILGLAIGITCCLLIFQYVAFEKSYDKFNEKAAQIVRLRLDLHDQGKLTMQSATVFPGLGSRLKNDFPEVKNYCRLIDTRISWLKNEMVQNNVVLANDERNVKGLEDKGYYADQSFLDMFTIPVVEGNHASLLNGPGKIILSESTAGKYFGNEDAVGKKITVREGGNTYYYEVTGVFKNYPANSHLSFDYLVSYPTFVNMVRDLGAPKGLDPETTLNWYDYYVYLQLQPGTNQKLFDSKLVSFSDRYLNNEYSKAHNNREDLYIIPLTDIHLYSHYNEEAGVNGDGKSVSFLFLIAFLIIVIAWINYTNLATARSLERAKEVGVRKVLGALRKNLVGQFLTESFMLNFAAVVIAVLLAFLFTPAFNRLIGSASDAGFHLPLLYCVGFILLFFMGTFVSGIYPAFVLSGFHPITVLKGMFKNSASGTIIRKGLIIGQFATSIILIAGTIVIYQQVNFMRNQKLGANINETLVLNGPSLRQDSTYQNFYQAFKNDVLQTSGIKSIAASSGVMGKEIYMTNGAYLVNSKDKNPLTFYTLYVDDDFLSSYGMQFKAGRNFSRDNPSDKKAVVLSEEAAKLFGINDPEKALNQVVFNYQDSFKIIGVVANYHQLGLNKAMLPVMFIPKPAVNNFYSIKFQTANVHQTIASVEKVWNKYFPENPFSYFFLDELYNAQYKSDSQFGKVFGLFSFLAIIIACFGLLGLSAYNVLQRTKEIGIRKVLGASTGHLIYLLSKDFLLLVGIAFIVAVPVTWFVMKGWLNDFAYRINISWWIFLIAGFIALLIALLTVSFQAIKAAIANPVKSLRTE